MHDPGRCRTHVDFFFFLLLFPLYKLILAEKLFAIYETRSAAAAAATTKRDESKSSIK